MTERDDKQNIIWKVIIFLIQKILLYQ